MLFVPHKSSGVSTSNMSPTTSVTPGGTVVTGAAAATKGAPVQLFAALPWDVFLIDIAAWNYGVAGVTSECCVDIMIGAAGSEVVIIPNLLAGFCGGDVSVNPTGPKSWRFPLYMPAGARISARAAGARLNTTVKVSASIIGGTPNFRVGKKVTTYMGTGAVPNGMAITPGAAAVEGAWTQLVAATAESHFCLVPSFQVVGDATINTLFYAADIGIGAAGAEAELRGGYRYITSASEQMGGPYGVVAPVVTNIPIGSRLVMRVSNSGANDAGYGCALHAVS